MRLTRGPKSGVEASGINYPQGPSRSVSGRRGRSEGVPAYERRAIGDVDSSASRKVTLVSFPDFEIVLELVLTLLSPLTAFVGWRREAQPLPRLVGARLIVRACAHLSGGTRSTPSQRKPIFAALPSPPDSGSCGGADLGDIGVELLLLWARSEAPFVEYTDRAMWGASEAVG